MKVYEIVRPVKHAAIGEQFHADAFDPKKGRLRKLGTLEELLSAGTVREIATRVKAAPAVKPAEPPVEPPLDPKS